MEIDSKIIKQIVRQILTVAEPDKVILFGTAATGRMTRDSDIDLLIVKSDNSNQRREYVHIRKALWNLDYVFDIIFITPQWFEQSKDIVGGIAYPASKYGKVIYEAA